MQSFPAVKRLHGQMASPKKKPFRTENAMIFSNGSNFIYIIQWGLLLVVKNLILCQRLVEETERVGDEGGGKLRSSKTATPTLLLRVNIQDAATHLLVRGLYFSMEFRLELPSLPPTA